MPRSFTHVLSVVGSIVAAIALSPLASADEPETTPAPVRFPRVSVEGRLWFLALDGNLRISGRNASGQTVKGTFLGLTDEYDLDTTQGAPELVGRLDLGGRLGMSASYMEIGAEGNPTLRRDIAFDGRVYNAGDYLSTALELRYARGMLEWTLVNHLGVSAALIGGIAYVHFDAEIERVSGSPPSPTRSHESGGAPIPMFGVAGRFTPLPWFSLRGELAGLGGVYHDIRGLWLDATAGAYVLPVKHIAFGVGLRLLHVDIDNLDLGDRARGEGRFTLYGIFGAIEIRV